MKQISQGVVSATPFPARVPVTEECSVAGQLDGLYKKIDALQAFQAGTAAEVDAMLPAILDWAFKGEL